MKSLIPEYIRLRIINGGMFSSYQAPSDKEIILARFYLDKDASVGSFEEMILALPNLAGDDVALGSADGTSTPAIKTLEVGLSIGLLKI